jgi:hypothetical protein
MGEGGFCLSLLFDLGVVIRTLFQIMSFDER